MILPDLNLLVYAYNTASPWHERARLWWEDSLNGAEIVGLAPVVALGFVRLMSNPRVLVRPVRAAILLDVVAEWLDTGRVKYVAPGMRHVRIMRGLFEASAAGSTMTTDIHLAALAIEQGATIASNDTDFRRLAGFTLLNPLA
ncbi:MAG: TA system VapC family ribonuclease toxin [Spirochaetota bacterium]